jgi:hypothetical protein
MIMREKNVCACSGQRILFCFPIFSTQDVDPKDMEGQLYFCFKKFKNKKKPCQVLTPVTSPAREAEIRRMWLKVSCGKELARPISTSKLAIVVHTHAPSYVGDISRRIVV